MAKFIFVTGGVVSGLGKGISAASLGRLLKGRGMRVSVLKFDPYINVDPGTMSPYQHGEVFVTEDGAETDLDLGHYERFINVNLERINNVTTGEIYKSVIEKERSRQYDGKTVQVIPHITNEIKASMHRVATAQDAEIVIVEIGGTVGDIESLPFLEAIRQMRTDVGRENVMYLHVTLVPYLKKSGELKTKPTQHSVKELRSLGIQPDVIICRSEMPLSEEIKAKLALFCDIEPAHVIENLDLASIYEVPMLLEQQRLDEIVIRRLELDCAPPDLKDWRRMVEQIKAPKPQVNIALVGKYVSLYDAYRSVVEALYHGGIANDVKVNIKWVDSEAIDESQLPQELVNAHGIVVPDGFGRRGIPGKIWAIDYALKEQIPLFGICLGMQLAVIAFARWRLPWAEGANSREYDPHTCLPFVDMPQGRGEGLEPTMRLGTYACKIEPDSMAARIYQDRVIRERYRHRFEVNNQYRQALAAAGLVLSGTSPDGQLVEIIEYPLHPWFMGVQFHPEFKSRPNHVHPLFKDFVGAVKKQAQK